MRRPSSSRAGAGRLPRPCALFLFCTATAATAHAQAAPPAPHPRPARPAPASSSGDNAFADSAFAAVQARGTDRRGMGVDQATSVHRFDALPDGGQIELRRAVADTAGVAQIRRHLRDIASAFGAGDFRTPAFVHMRQVPGTAVMAAKRAAITYAVGELPGGGEVRITTRDPEALAAVHAFVAFQRGDHRAGGAGTPQPAHGGHHAPPG